MWHAKYAAAAAAAVACFVARLRMFLLAPAGLLQVPFLGIPGLVNFIDVRTQWFDAAVQRAIADGITQVVVIAAGYDTRAYRLGQPGVKFYEVDLPHASEMKQELVKQHMPRDKVRRGERAAAAGQKLDERGGCSKV
jgi:methyltransferase (TIGR00027 family)